MTTTPSTRIRVAVIGAGNWGRNLVRTFHGLNALEAVVETDDDLRSRLGEQYKGVPLYSDYRDVLSDGIDAVVVATPVSTHHVIAREALIAGKDVFVEKPIALSVAQAEDLNSISTQLNRVLMVGHLLIYQPAVQFVKECLSDGRIGRLQSVHQERLNLGRARAVENALWSLGVHDVAVALYLVGEPPVEVKAVGQCVLQPGIEDDVHLHVGFRDGVRAHLHASWLWPEKRRRLTVIGSEAMLVYDELAQAVTLHRKCIVAGLENRDHGSEAVFEGIEDPLILECRNFLKCVADRETPLSDGRGAAEVVRVLEQAGSMRC